MQPAPSCGATSLDKAFVYIVRCVDRSLYVGLTRRSVEERIAEHNAGLPGSYTEGRHPVTLLHAEAHVRYDEAVAAERRIKGWSRAMKVAYIQGEFDALTLFARGRSGAKNGGCL